MGSKACFRKKELWAFVLVAVLFSSLILRSYSQPIKILKKNSCIELTLETEDDLSEDDDDELRQEYTVVTSSILAQEYVSGVILPGISIERSCTNTIIVNRWIRFCQMRLCEEAIPA